ncbi:hypothetical protein DMN91_001753 [Ooceraea biroi]|uniref:Uncharacterized protein n=1 Tax=Ooceraea biroi TaxID=2015173 RepID=A0A3L8DZ22_OOCBI|nr:uncharacterized protein LOC105278924 [Ooceraea biroi]RLU25596.1 hypothetical protein DMN91_001753 [Ooceraea biroi]
MVDCITICNTACIACIWCILFSVCFPNFSRNLRKADSSECCIRGKPARKRNREAHSRDFPRCGKADAVHARRRFKDRSRSERNREDRRGRRSRCEEKTCSRIRGSHRGSLKEDETISPTCSGVRCADGCNILAGSGDSLGRKSDNAVLRADSSEYRICRRS